MLFRHPIYPQRQIARFARLLSLFWFRSSSHDKAIFLFVHNPGWESELFPNNNTHSSSLHSHEEAADSGLAAKRSMTL